MGSAFSLLSYFYSLRSTSLEFFAITLRRYCNYRLSNIQVHQESYKMNIWKKNEENYFSKVKRLAEGFPSHQSHSAVQKITSIFNALFQSYNQSLLSNLYEEGFKKNNKDQKKTLIFATELFDPESQFGRAILLNKDAKIEVDNLDYSSDFDHYLRTSELTKSGIARKQDYTFRIPLLDCFFANLALCLTALKDQQRKIDKWETAFYQDEFYHYIVRNPILVIIKNWLNYSKPNYALYSRILKVLQIILLKDLSVQARKTERASIKSAILYGIYVISDWKVGTYHWEALQSISENIQKRGNSANLFSLWIRINLAILMNGTSFEEKSRRDLREYTYKYSQISRNYFSTLDQFDQQDFHEIDSKYFSSFLFKVEALVQKNFWECSPLFLQEVFILISLTQKIFKNQQQCQSRLRFLKNVFKKGNLGLKSQNKIRFFRKIKKYYQQKISRVSEDEEDEQNEDNYALSQSVSTVRRTQDRQIRNRKSLMTYQGDLSKLNSWQIPVQSNQSAILYEMSKWIATKVDKIRNKQPKLNKKGSKSYPQTDLRFLSSFKNFFIIIFLLVMPVYVIFM